MFFCFLDSGNVTWGYPPEGYVRAIEALKPLLALLQYLNKTSNVTATAFSIPILRPFCNAFLIYLCYNISINGGRFSSTIILSASSSALTKSIEGAFFCSYL
jgi:hypothetical protein